MNILEVEKHIGEEFLVRCPTRICKVKIIGINPIIKDCVNISFNNRVYYTSVSNLRKLTPMWKILYD